MPLSDADHRVRNEATAGMFNAVLRVLLFTVVALIGAFVLVAYAVAMFAAISSNANEWDSCERI